MRYTLTGVSIALRHGKANSPEEAADIAKAVQSLGIEAQQVLTWYAMGFEPKEACEKAGMRETNPPRYIERQIRKIVEFLNGGPKR